MNSSKANRKLLFVVSRFPYPLEKGDKLRAYYQIRELSKEFDVYLIALNTKNVESSAIDELKKYCTSVDVFRLTLFSRLLNSFLALLTNKPVQVGYFYNKLIHLKISRLIHKIQPDHIYSQLIRTTEYTKDYHLCSKTIDYMDALSTGIERRVEKASFATKWFFKLEAKRLKKYERIIFDYFEVHTIISDQDKKLILHPNRDQIVCIPNGISKSFFEYNPITDPSFDLVFVGNMSYAPNIEAVHFTHEKILSQNPNLNYYVSGATPVNSIKNLSAKSNQIELSGWVDDIRDSYSKGKIFFAPMHIGTGMQNKLLEAMAMGIPCITTDLANNAIKGIHNESIIVANSEVEMIDSINMLLKSKSKRKEIGEKGRQFVFRHYNWKDSTKTLIEAINVSIKK